METKKAPNNQKQLFYCKTTLKDYEVEYDWSP